MTIFEAALMISIIAVIVSLAILGSNWFFRWEKKKEKEEMNNRITKMNLPYSSINLEGLPTKKDFLELKEKFNKKKTY